MSRPPTGRRRLARRLAALLLGMGLAATATGQALERPPLPLRPQPGLEPSVFDLRRRLVELDQLLNLGSVGRAEALLKELQQHGRLRPELVSRRIRLAQLQDRHAEAVDQCRRALVAQPLVPGLWRSLAESLLAVDRPDSARLAVDRFLATSPNLRSAAVVGVDLLGAAGRHEAAGALIDSLRGVLADPRFLARQRALGLLARGRPDEAADEVAAELAANPFNLGLLRNELLEGPFRPRDHARFVERLQERAAGGVGGAAAVLLAGNLRLAGGDGAGAVALVRPLLAGRAAALTVLQNTATLARELEMLPETAPLQPLSDYLLEILDGLLAAPALEAGLQRRAAETLAEVCRQALARGTLGADPQAAVDRFAARFERLRELLPGSESLYSAQIQLAAYTRDVLREPAAAARRLEHLLLDLNLPNEGVAVVRLTLGECYLAAGDTARGRVVLTRLGRDADFHQAAGHAHYHLARLDLAEGHFATARDRFAVVAMDNPAAGYANDALDLGLAIAEELDNPSGGPAILELYAVSVYHDLTAAPERRLAALESFVREAEARLDLAEPQHLLERARYELAGLYADAGRLDEAVDELARLTLEHPQGRYAAAALARRGELLLAAGAADAARESWRQLLIQYPDYLFVDDVRDDLRALP